MKPDMNILLLEIRTIHEVLQMGGKQKREISTFSPGANPETLFTPQGGVI